MSGITPVALLVGGIQILVGIGYIASAEVGVAAIRARARAAAGGGGGGGETVAGY